jgi:glutathionyl-hydroquinone reductase
MENKLVRGSAGITTDDQTNAAQRRQQGEFVRGVSTARNFVGVTDTDTGTVLYPVESGRYHLYVAFNCPWCHRVMLGRAIMGLEDVFTVDVCFPNRSTDDEPLGANLWKFEPNGVVGMNGHHVKFQSCTVDSVMNKKYVKEIYEAAGITNQRSVPILFDKATKTIVNNESAEILRMMGTVFRPLAKHINTIDLYPSDKASEINEINNWIYTDIANGAYKAGFSSNQEAYETAYQKFFVALDRLDNILRDKTFLIGDKVTEADVRLFPTLFRLDPVYYNRFKLNQRMLWEYQHLWRWMGTMIRLPGMEPVSNEEYLQHCKQGYFGRTGNGTIPLGPLGYPTSYLEKHWTHK